MEHELLIEFNSKCNFYKVTCPEGDYITDYTEDKDIETYISSTEMYVPGTYTEEQIRNQYRCITDEEKASFDKKRDEAMEERLKRDLPQEPEETKE